MSEKVALGPLRQDMVDKLVHALEADASWVQLYGVTGELVPVITPDEGDLGDGLRGVLEVGTKYLVEPWLGELTVHSDPEQEAVATFVWRVERNCHPCRCPPNACKCQATHCIWRWLIVVFEILAAARLQILESPFAAGAGAETTEKRTRPLYAGQPISALLTVKTSFHWAPPEDTRVESYVMRYDIEDLIHDWLVSGRKRGDFVAKVQSPGNSDLSLTDQFLGRRDIQYTSYPHCPSPRGT